MKEPVFFIQTLVRYSKSWFGHTADLPDILYFDYSDSILIIRPHDHSSVKTAATLVAMCLPTNSWSKEVFTRWLNCHSVESLRSEQIRQICSSLISTNEFKVKYSYPTPRHESKTCELWFLCMVSLHCQGDPEWHRYFRFSNWSQFVDCCWITRRPMRTRTPCFTNSWANCSNGSCNAWIKCPTLPAK